MPATDTTFFPSSTTALGPGIVPGPGWSCAAAGRLIAVVLVLAVALVETPQSAAQVTADRTTGTAVFEVVPRPRPDSLPTSRIDRRTERPLPATDDYGLRVEVIPREATILVNGLVAGTGRATLANPPARLRLQVRAVGYDDLDEYVDVPSATQVELSVQLVQRSGFLTVMGTPPADQILVDGAPASGYERLPEGRYRVRVRTFGYHDWEAIVMVAADQELVVRVQPEPAPMRITYVGSSRAIFRPDNPGLLGTTTVVFLTTAPGAVELLFNDAQGQTVLRVDFPAITTWSNRFVWDGRDAAGRPVADGIYSVVARPIDDPAAARQTTVGIDSALRYFIGAPHLGPPGRSIVPGAQTLPPGVISTAIRMVAHGQAAAAPPAVRLPVVTSFAAGLTPWLDIGLSLTFDPGVAQALLINARVGVTIGRLAEWFAVATVLDYGFLLTAESVGSAAFPPSAGLALRVPFEFSHQWFRLLLVPELAFDSTWQARPGARAAVQVDATPVSLGFAYFGDLIDGDQAITFDAVLLVPQSVFLLELLGGLRVGGTGDPGWSVGFGVGSVY